MTEECPLCCDELTAADTIYALHCQTPACNFNYCCECIQSLQRSAADGYQEASDGSNQLKVSVQCPQCRGKYDSKKYPSNIIVNSVLLLRKAHALSETLGQRDSELSATALQTKHSFIRETSLEDLKDAVRRLEVYHTEHGVDNAVPPLDWKEWSRYLPENSNSSLQNNNLHATAVVHRRPFCDLTLFMGLEELMTRDEQEFVTEMLSCGKAELLQQAAHILHGILHVSASRNAEGALQQLSTFGSNGSGGSSSATRKGMTKQELADTQKARKRWPLPTRMPRCVSLPVYDPEARSKLLKFKKHAADESQELVLAGVRGPAGRSGLRVGDIVTHIQGEAVTAQTDYAKAMWREFAEDPNDGSRLIVVNADDEIAKILHERSEEIKKHYEKVRQGLGG
jgi:signal recognition particle subunit SEC65